MTASIRKSRRQPTDGVELPDEHSWCRRGSLTDLVEGEFGKAIKPHRRHPDTQMTAGVVPIPFKWRALSEREQCIGKPVNRCNPGKGIVDCGRQRTDCNFDYLRDAELAILGKGAVTTDVNSTINCCRYVADLIRWDYRCERLTAKHELARTKLEHDERVRCVRCCDQRAMIDVL